MSSQTYLEEERAIIPLLALSTADAIQGARAVGSGSLPTLAEASINHLVGEWAEAARGYQEVLRLDPASPLAQAGSVALLADHGAKVDSLTRLSERHPNLERPLLFLGFALLDAGKAEQAVDVLRRCVELAPQDTHAWSALGNALLASHERDGAAHAASRLAEVGHCRFESQRTAAQLLFKARRYREAFQLARDASSRFHGARATLLPWSLPLQALSRRRRLLFGLSLLALITFVADLEIRGNLNPALSWASIAGAWVLVAWGFAANYSEDRGARRRRFRRFKKVKTQLAGDLNAIPH